jgi:inosine-uridine nucleoside N-ribohydrolase
MHRVVLDMDPGIDDAIALLLALNDPGIEVAAIATVSGNVNLEKGTANALRILQSMSRRIPVYKGASRPAGGKSLVRAESVHGSDGLGDAGIDLPRRRAEKIRALQMMVELLESAKRKEISIVATGPLTNIAVLSEKEPSLIRRLDRIFVMGGLYDPSVRGNVSEYSEFNFFFDPESADKVMGTSVKQYPAITAAGLDVTSHPGCAVDGKSLKMIRSIGTRASDIASKILNWPVLTYSYFNLHDVFALFALTHPEIFVTERCSVRVAHDGNFRGRCNVASGKGNVSVCTKVNVPKFNQFVLDGLRNF